MDPEENAYIFDLPHSSITLKCPSFHAFDESPNLNTTIVSDLLTQAYRTYNDPSRRYSIVEFPYGGALHWIHTADDESSTTVYVGTARHEEHDPDVPPLEWGQLADALVGVHHIANEYPNLHITCDIYDEYEDRYYDEVENGLELLASIDIDWAREVHELRM